MIAMEDVTRKLLHISMALTQFRTRLLCLLTASNSSWQDMLSVPRRKWWSSRKREEMQTSLLIRPVQETHKDNMYPLSNRTSFMSIWSLHMPCRRQDMGMSINDFDDGEINVVQHNSVRVSSSELFLLRSNPFQYQSEFNFLFLFRNALLCV